MSLRSHLQLFDDVAAGRLGAEPFYAMVGIAQAKVAAVKQPVVTGQAMVSSEFTNDNDRRRRLAEVLRRRETTETATGSISPNPPHGDS